MHRGAFAALSCLLLSPPSLAAETPSATALAALDRGDAAAARPILRAEAALAMYHLALAESGEERKSLAAHAVRLSTGLGGWLEPATRGLSAWADGDAQAAVSAYREASAAEGADARLWKQLGDLLVQGGDSAGARAAYERAVALDRRFPLALMALGDLQREAGDLGAAFNSYNHAVGDDGRPVAALIGRGTTSLFLGDREGATRDFQRAAGIAPAGDRQRALMGLFYVRAYDRQAVQGLSHVEEAITSWTAEGRADMVAATANAAGRVLLESGEPALAESWYRRGGAAVAASSLAAEQKSLWRIRELHGLTRAAAQRGDGRRTEQLLVEVRTAIEADLANAEHYQWTWPYLVGYVRLLERRYDEAIAELRQSDTERPHVRMLIAEAYARKRDRASAREWYQRAQDAATGLDAESVVVRPAARAWLERNR